ncbi:MAG: hypothetical protein LWX83_08605 [Anaerolineae bacterium]|nr:hypothetical protein [Anaerolineae bacterium]
MAEPAEAGPDDCRRSLRRAQGAADWQKKVLACRSPVAEPAEAGRKAIFKLVK